MKDYSVSDKYKYFCKMSKVGAKKNNGTLLTDFERGVYMGKAIMLQQNAIRYKNSKQTSKKSTGTNSKIYTHVYSDAELNSLFDNLK